MNPNELLPPPRPIPVIVLADTSTSMAGEKINALNTALAQMQQDFCNLHDPSRKIHLAIITFATHAKVQISLQSVDTIQLNPLQASGTTAMGEAFQLTLDLLEDEKKMPKRSYLPNIVLVSDGKPNDEWEEPLTKLLNSDRGKRAVRLALGIGNDCNLDVLKRFINHSEIPVMRANQVSKLTDFFRFVTMSVMARSTARNPNAIADLPIQTFTDDDDDLEF